MSKGEPNTDRQRPDTARARSADGPRHEGAQLTKALALSTVAASIRGSRKTAPACNPASDTQLLTTNPARNRSRRSLGKNPHIFTDDASPRTHALPDLASLETLAATCGKVHQSYSDYVMLCALLVPRGSEVAGLQIGDIDWDNRIVTIRRQTFPGAGGLVTKQTKGRNVRHVPILQALAPVLERLTDAREPEDRLVTGPRGGVLTAATVRDATKWDTIVTKLGLPDLTRHGLRHTGATWFADAGIPLHVLQKILGHQSSETTRGYLHPDHRRLAAAAAQANAFLTGWSPTKRPQRRLLAAMALPDEYQFEPVDRAGGKTLKGSRPFGPWEGFGRLLVPFWSPLAVPAPNPG